MTIGEKIKKIRVSKGITQEDVASGKITRNMLSAIENNKAMPSLDTLNFISSQLGVPASYFISNDSDIFQYEKNYQMPLILEKLKSKNYQPILDMLSRFETLDDELNYILAMSSFELGVKHTKSGALKSAIECFETALNACGKTLYETSRFEKMIPLYMALAKNISAPLLELDHEEFNLGINSLCDLEFYKYILNDHDYVFLEKPYSDHMKAKKLIRERKYTDAINILQNLAETQKKNEYNAYLIFSVYSDLENCCKQICDFENAYRYATKRVSLLEGFNS